MRLELTPPGRGGISSQHPVLPRLPGVAAAPLNCCISTQFWVYQCVLQNLGSLKINIFLMPVWLCPGAATGCPPCRAMWSGTGLDETAWAEGEGEEPVLGRGEKKRVCLIRALSKLRAPRAACCQRGGSCEKPELENEGTYSPAGWEALSPLHKSHSQARGGTVTIRAQSERLK